MTWRMEPPLVTPVGLVLALVFGQVGALIFGEGATEGLLLGLGLVLAGMGDSLWQRRQVRRGS